MSYEIGMLLCRDIDIPTRGGIKGHGIQVIPNAIGHSEEVLQAWRGGRLQVLADWPNYSNNIRIGQLHNR